MTYPDAFWLDIDLMLAMLYALALIFSKPKRRETAACSLAFFCLAIFAADLMIKTGVDYLLYHVGLFAIIAMWLYKISDIGSKTVWVSVAAMGVFQVLMAIDAWVMMILYYFGIGVPAESPLYKNYGVISLGLNLITIFFIWSWPFGKRKTDHLSDADHYHGQNRG